MNDAMPNDPPAVGIVMPIFNAGRFLAEALDSVLAQSFSDWVAVVVDNHSTDATAEVAQRYAAADPRIVYHRTDEHRPMIPNWNHTMRRAPAGCRYVKVLHGDDRMMPNCLAEMVALADTHPTVGVVGSYYLRGTHVQGSDMPVPKQPVTPGKQMVRQTLLELVSLFGSPSNTMLRADVVQAHDAAGYYEQRFFHADKAACLRDLHGCDFGFVPQILTYTRLHEDSQTATRGRSMCEMNCERLFMLESFGPGALSDDEMAYVKRKGERTLYRFLARQAMQLDRAGRLKFHRQRLAAERYGFSWARVFGAGFGEAARLPAKLWRKGDDDAYFVEAAPA